MLFRSYKQLKKSKRALSTFFGEASFKLQMWHSNVPELESSSELSSRETMLAKEQLGTPQGGQDCLLGLSWNKEADTIEI